MRPRTPPPGFGRRQRPAEALRKSPSACLENPRAHRRAAHLPERRRSRGAGEGLGVRCKLPALDYGFVLSRTLEDDAEDHRQAPKRNRRAVQIRSRRRTRVLLTEWLGADGGERHAENCRAIQAAPFVAAIARAPAGKESPRGQPAVVRCLPLPQEMKCPLPSRHRFANPIPLMQITLIDVRSNFSLTALSFPGSNRLAPSPV